MAGDLPGYPGLLGHNRCPVHPSEPLVGMCGCGTLFCRRCSPSAVFCARCHRQHQHASHQVSQTAIADPGWHFRHPAHGYGRPLTHKILLDALFMTVLATLALTAVFGIQNSDFTVDASQNAISYGINTGNEPIQHETSLFKTNVAVPGGTATLSSDTSYSINAKVESARFYDDTIGDLVPYDLLLAWGDLALDDVDSRLDWEQDDRRGQVSGSLGSANGVNLSTSYVIGHVSNNHLIPSTDRIARAMKNIKAGDMVRINGRLVDIRMSLNDNRVLTVNTSKTRTDQGEGACEVIYVEQLRVNGQS